MHTNQPNAVVHYELHVPLLCNAEFIYFHWLHLIVLLQYTPVFETDVSESCRSGIHKLTEFHEINDRVLPSFQPIAENTGVTK